MVVLAELVDHVTGVDPDRAHSGLKPRANKSRGSPFLRMGWVDPVDGLARMGEPEDEHVALRLNAVQHYSAFPESTSASAPGAGSWGTKTSTRRPASPSIWARRTRT
jgi:hypothetical protein